MADALLKVSDATKKADACKTADDDGLLVTTLLEALTTTNRLDVGAHGRTTYTPSNYSTAGQSLDQHLTGVDSVLAGVGAAHALGGGQHSADTLANLNAKVTGGDLDFDSASRPPSGSATGDLTSSYPNPQVAKIRGYAVQAHAPLDGEVLQWVSANSQYEPTAAGAPGAHLLGGTSHTADSLANLNSKVNLGNLDFDTAARPAVQHTLGSNIRHGADSLANVNALITGGNLDFDSASRPPSGSASGDLSGTYPGPTVAKIAGYTVQTGAPSTGDLLQYSGAQWAHVASLSKIVVNQTAAADSVDIQDGGVSVLKIYDGGIVDLPKQSGCSVYRNAAWDLPDDAWTKIPFDAESFDIQSEFNTTTNTFTATKAGYYLVTAIIRMTVALNVNIGLEIQKNGGRVSITYDRGNGWTNTVQCTMVLQLAATNTVIVTAYQNSGGVSAITPGYAYTRLHIMKLA